MKLVPHGEPYAGKLHVRFDEGYPPRRRRVAKRCPGRGAGVPHGASRSTLHPCTSPEGGEREIWLPAKLNAKV